MSELYRAKMLVMRTEIKLNAEAPGTEIALERYGQISGGIQQIDRVTVLCAFLAAAPRVGEMLEVVIYDVEEP